ncbi:hypothetical protein DNH61_16365 [Paenibacillus sambharensis]|uniref:Uncharacterized protein n=1 Tax=Paenibacillus sambharensis TaxID=1803190 RepID=A0A2W1L770_9BACL|nr:hypothetical protein [Paenibacillus sambharensis]PZD94803.1 hypothetical protein DNH61_16365 [Paenibacillus sambharensis]
MKAVLKAVVKAVVKAVMKTVLKAMVKAVVKAGWTAAALSGKVLHTLNGMRGFFWRRGGEVDR